jgi:superfamily I DNA/RNA helicase
MDQGTLTIYSASAGSGKTFRLTGIYLSHLFRSRYNYRKILAVTFTNKATAEMKSRILDHLYELATGGKSAYLDDLISETKRDEALIRREAKEILFAILHDFSRFSVCTIDTFFQKVIRSFARETGLHSGYNIELDHSIILSMAVDEMIASSAEKRNLAMWLNSYVMSNLDEEKTWNLKESIIRLSEELFREKFKIMSADGILRIGDKEFMRSHTEKVKSVKGSFESGLISLGRKCEMMLSGFGLTDDMFYYKGHGVPGYIRSLARGNIIGPNSYVRKTESDPPKWSSGEISPAMQEALKGGLEAALKETLHFYDSNIMIYNSALVILSNIYALGILSDVLENVREVASSENSFLISDAGEILYNITRGDQTPFIYEKIGNKFDNYMIDEFQDTSYMQWNNFSPLIMNSMGEGNDNLVVGDVKQSIYRFRNSDWHMLEQMKNELADNKRIISKPLDRNWRSRSNIVRFNNSLFSVIPMLADEKFSGDPKALNFRNLYSEAIQDGPEKETGGYVRLEFVEDAKAGMKSDPDPNPTTDSKKWKDIVIEKIPSLVEAFQDKGYRASDIGILVRTSREGAEVLERMIEYGNNADAGHKAHYNYNVVSNDSLVLSNSPAVKFIIACLRALDDPHDMISRAVMARFCHMSRGDADSEKIPLFREKLLNDPDGYFPEGFEDFMEKVVTMPLFEAVENMISFFGLGNYAWNVPYLNAFQDLTLNYSGSRSSDFTSFLDWWDEKGGSGSVVLPANQDAARVLTIHKSKGLEFPVVILPFLSWNTDHEPSKQPFIWVKPATEPFSNFGMVPLRYSEKLEETVFAESYREEKYSCFLDNINLLYVAMTRAIDAIYGLVPSHPGPNNGIARLIREALMYDKNMTGDKGVMLANRPGGDKNVLEIGEIPVRTGFPSETKSIVPTDYTVSRGPEMLKLKLHGENYFSPANEELRERINYGRLMHEVFERIASSDDIPSAVRQLALDGKISGTYSAMLEKKLKDLVSVPSVSEWFRPGNKVLREAEILLPSGSTKRPDRIILSDGKAVIIDFKFGKEEPHYIRQISEYRDLMSAMGYSDVSAFIWYVEKNKVVTV